MKKIITILLAAMLLLLCACEKKDVVKINYGNAKAFEKALNDGEKMEGMVVQFTVDELHPQSIVGYNLWAGEHLNFVSAEHPGIKEGDTLTVRVTEVYSWLGSWFIYYEMVENAKKDKKTVE